MDNRNIVILAVVVGVILLIVVSMLAMPRYRPNMDRQEAPQGAPNSFTPTGRFGPDKYGVTCYRYLESISCVRTQ